MKHFNISFHNGNLNPDISIYQKKVFDKLGIELTQIETDLQHGQAIDHWLKNNDWNTVTVFDIDCIPLNGESVKIAIDKAVCGILYGAAQQAGHIEGSWVYVSPAFMSFSKVTYDSLARPSFVATKKGDVGAEMTHEAFVKCGYELIWPTHVEAPKWALGSSSQFGLGTTYQTGVYHAFESRMGNGKMFIEKCKKVLNAR